MKIKSKIILLSLLVGSMTSAHAVKLDTDITSRSITPSSIPADQLLLGQGVDTDLGNGASTCLQVQNPVVGVGTGGSVMAFGTYSQTELERDLSRSSNVSISMPSVFSAGGSSSFSSYSKDKTLSLVFRMKSEFYHESLRYITHSLDQFGSVYYNMIANNDYESFRRSCGNRFVREIKRGGAMYATVRVDFASSEDYAIATQNGSASISIGSLTGGGGSSITQSWKSSGVQGSITVIGAQRGGKPEQLTQLFGGSDGSADIASCSIQGDTQSCINMITNVINYGNSFADQFDPANGVPSYTVLEYVPQSYRQAYGIEELLRHPDVTPEVIEKRNRLKQEVDSHYDHYIATSNIYDILNTKVDKTRAIDQEDYLFSTVIPNINEISYVGRECWYFPLTCHQYYIPLFPSEGSVNPDGSFNPAPSVNPDGTPVASSLAPLDEGRIAYDIVLPQVFSLGGTQAFYAKPNGDYCQIYDARYKNCDALYSGGGLITSLINRLNCEITNPVPIYPTGDAYQIPVSTDLTKINNNMDQIGACKVSTDKVYSDNISHPYGCRIEERAAQSCITIWGMRFCFPTGEVRLYQSCPDSNLNKYCDSPNTYQDTQNAARCP